MTAFKEIPIGNYVLRFWPSDNGWMCGITPSMMEALEQQATPPQRTWVGLTDKEIEAIWEVAMFANYGVGAELSNQPFVHYARAIEAKLKEKNG